MNMRYPLTGALVLSSLMAFAAEDQRPATLKALEDREIEIQQSESEPVDERTALENFRRLLELTDDPAQKQRVKRRLADLELELSAEDADPSQGAERALKLYDELLAAGNTPAGSRDRLLYQKARAADESGQREIAIDTLGQLIQRHADSPLIADARFRRAEMLFTDRDFARAEPDYLWLVERGDKTPFFTQSLYKLGWTHYKLSQHRRSLDAFNAVLKRIVSSEQIGPHGTLKLSGVAGADREIVSDSLRAITLNFAQLGKSLPPGQYIDQHDAEAFEYLIYKNLLAHYLDKQRFTDASQTANAFARRNPQHPEAKAFEVASIKALEDGGFPTLALERKQGYVQRYGIERESWYGKDPLEVAKVRNRLTNYLDEITQTYHAAAQKSGKAEDYGRAAKWYDTYLAVFPDIERAPELAFLRAEVLYEAGRPADAAEAYKQVAYAMGDHAKASEAAYASVLAWRKAATGKPPAKASDEQVRAATLRFAEQYPRHPQASAALMRLAEELYAADQLPQASKIASQVIAHEPKAQMPRLQDAWRIRAAAAEQAGDYTRAEQALTWLLEHAATQDRPDLRERLAAAIYKQGEELAKAGEDTAAAEQFLRIQKTVPARGEAASRIRTTALYDAAQASLRAGKKAQATQLLERFRSEHPDNKLTPEATRQLAALYLEQGKKAEAAQAFSQIRQQTDISAEVRREAARETARLHAERGNKKAAIDAYEVYLREHKPAFDERIEAQQKLIDLHSETGSPNRADAWRQQLIQAHEQAGGAATDRSRTLAARASLSLANTTRTRFEAARLTRPLKASLKTKKQRLEDALDAYGRAADYGIAEVTTAATFRIGQLYYDFSQALLDSPAPRGLQGDEAAQYQLLLEEQAFPFEEKAIEIHEANVARIADGLYDKWVQKSLTQLGKLLPVRYAKQERLSNAL